MRGSDFDLTLHTFQILNTFVYEMLQYNLWWSPFLRKLSQSKKNYRKLTSLNNEWLEKLRAGKTWELDNSAVEKSDQFVQFT